VPASMTPTKTFHSLLPSPPMKHVSTNNMLNCRAAWQHQ
jgi:hypothetical protein